MRSESIDFLKGAVYGVVLAVVACGFLLFAVPARAQAQATGFRVGEVLNHMLSVCLNKADALEIVNADVAKGRDAAVALWESKDKCQTVPVDGPIVGRVVFEAKVDRPSGKASIRVVEILDPETKRVAAYFLTTLPFDVRPVGSRAVRGNGETHRF